jgi:hypothetical protein
MRSVLPLITSAVVCTSKFTVNTCIESGFITMLLV